MMAASAALQAWKSHWMRQRTVKHVLLVELPHG
jgi:hypothetical protein